ncbi:hypothetical protein MUY27_13850 [Mucilaginibacter sp. RS28]|uniref:Uncharacterized protein n=1 Tax=Mucilaginibacter straminoryzae TaxID=2932774 RepID=A0A9X2BCD2_9SPHI|nr:hypothetical protein [Mucilaginibacter straminoryzae]MCJ8210797.1 hypothetical protein [Mucilaginibacter straminoryzae]
MKKTFTKAAIYVWTIITLVTISLIVYSCKKDSFHQQETSIAETQKSNKDLIADAKFVFR